MDHLSNVAIYLTAAVLSVALMKRLGFAAVLGYLVAGVVIGPWVTGLIGEVERARELAEFGVVLLLFVIGLELQPSRLWALRRPIFGMGTAQLLATGTVLALAALAFGLPPALAAVTGLGLAMSSTAFVLQLLAEKGELGSTHGRASFAVLLFQDLAVIPLLAVVPLLASSQAMDGQSAALGVLKVVVVCGLLIALSRVVVRRLFDAVARTEVPEIFTATALLVVIATTLLMQAAGLSATLGAFLAGVLLADSEYRHEIEARVAPFSGLLLGLFFISVGMSANLGLLAREPFAVAGLVAGLMALKFGAMLAVAKAFKVGTKAALKLGAALCQGGEFAFILFGLARTQGLLAEDAADLLTLVVSASMALTPLAYAGAGKLARRLGAAKPAPAFDALGDAEHQVILAGFDRFGQIIGRILRAMRIPFTALESNPEQLALHRRYGHKAYFGDASNLDLLLSAHVDKAKLFIVAIEDVETSLRVCELVRRHFPDIRIFARARDRQHAYRLMDLGVDFIERELYHSSLHMTEQILVALGYRPARAKRAVLTFRGHDEKTLKKSHAFYKDEAKLIQTVKEAADELQTLFEADSGFANLPESAPGVEAEQAAS
ncbi:MAG: cation:proton antiporter [Gammaproteobacteria bacterium]|nr:cation:proton antiporter [Gammaproteobacteria bacterium]